MSMRVSSPWEKESGQNDHKQTKKVGDWGIKK